MQIESTLTDTAVLLELGDRITRRRLDADQSQERFAAEAGVSRRTVQRLEAGESVQLTSFIRVLRALGTLGALDEVVARPVPSPMEQLRLAGRRRRRAGRTPVPGDAVRSWSWGDDPDDR